MEKLRAHIKTIVSRLGPGLHLEIDTATFSMAFGGDLGNELAEIEADRLARNAGAGFISDGKVARFSRAYFASAGND